MGSPFDVDDAIDDSQRKGLTLSWKRLSDCAEARVARTATWYPCLQNVESLSTSKVQLLHDTSRDSSRKKLVTGTIVAAVTRGVSEAASQMG